MAEHVAGAVDARALAVPQAEHAIELAFAAQFRLLRAPKRRGGEVLVDAALKLDVGGFEMPPRAYELLVEPAGRRPAIAGDEPRRIEPRAPVQFLLHEAQPDQRLVAGREDAAFAQVEFVIERDVCER